MILMIFHQLKRISATAVSRAAPTNATLCPVRKSLPACPTILDVIGDLLADGCQIEEFPLDEGIFGLFGKLPIHGRLLPEIVIPVHASSCLAELWPNLGDGRDQAAAA